MNCFSFLQAGGLVGLMLTAFATAAPAQAGTYHLYLARPALKVTSTQEPVVPVRRPQLELAAAHGLDFGLVKIGKDARLNFTLHNSGDAPATGVFVGFSSTELSVVDNTCGAAQSPFTVPEGASCAVTVQWSPASGSNLAATVNVTSPIGGNPVSLNVTGSVQEADPQAGNLGMLLHFDGAPGATMFADNSSPAVNGTAVGSAALTSTVAKFGSTSLASGTNSYASFPWKASYTLKGSYTVEAWVYLRAVPAPNPRGSTCSSMAVAGDGNGWQLSYCHNTGALGIGSYGNSSGQLHTSYAMPLNQWTHIAVVRNGTNNAIYVNGISQPLTANTFVGQEVPSGVLTVGSERRYSGWDHDFPGYIDELRITNGVARYTGNFTVPQAAFPNP